MQATAVVMNMFYTGLGIARSLDARGIPVIGLTAHRMYGSYTRSAKIVLAPDSKTEPEALLVFLLRLAEQTDDRAVIFPTRDDDVVFLDRFRRELTPHYSLVIPTSHAIAVCLDKWQTYLCAMQAGVATPKSWLIESEEDLTKAAREASYPCVLKPLAAHHWRRGHNWEIVGGRKAIAIRSREDLLIEYGAIAQADHRVLLQEMIPGGDDCLVVTACYIDQKSRWAGAFNAQKLVQEPEGFGTGCVLQATCRPELIEPTQRLLRKMNFSGVAEVEYKWDETAKRYLLIEVNARPWDQHVLGRTCGVDVIYLAYCDHAGLPIPSVQVEPSAWKWIADDAFLIAFLRSIKRRDGKYRALLRAAKGKRVYGIWSPKDPFPFLAYFIGRLVPLVAGAGLRRFWSRFTALMARHAFSTKGGSAV